MRERRPSTGAVSPPRTPGRRLSPRRGFLSAVLAGAIGMAVPAGGAGAGAVAVAQAQQAPSPADVLGYDPVATATLPSWAEIAGYFATLAEQSPRVVIDTIGRSTLDRPMIVVTISSEHNLARLEELKAIQAKLADPRRIKSAAEREGLIASGKLVVLISAGIHSTEVGGPLAAMRLAHTIATSPAPGPARIREEAVVLIVPAVNPDGIDPVKEWYESSKGTPWVGSEPPELYHHYAGHDLNRDWYAFTQKEIRAIVDRVHQVWHPQIDHDMHQHESTSARYFVPPWLDPVEANVDPLLIAAATSLGTRVQWSMLEEGKTGISVAARYDAWSPARAYAHYHAGVRLLSETASARLATPVDLEPSDLVPTPGLDPRVPSWNHPIPWPGGRWGLAEIVSYMESGALAMLGIASSEREMWLRNFERVGRRAVEGWPAWPEAWIIRPPARPDPDGFAEAGVAELIRILRQAGVEVRRATEPFQSEGREIEAGSYVVDMHQPYAGFAQAVLAPQPYPQRREYAGGPPVAPYDVTAHNLPLLLGVRTVPSHEAPPARLERVDRNPPAPPRHVKGLSGETSVMVGLYQPWTPSIDEGWTRWVFDNYSVPYARVTNDEVARGELLREYTAIVIPSISPDELRKGRSAGAVPPEYAGGLGPAAIESLRSYVAEGGTLVSFGSSVGFVIEALGLPVEDFIGPLSSSEFYAPGSLVGLRVDSTSSLGRGMPPTAAAWIEGGAAFRVLPGGGMTVAARYAETPVTRSGWVVGGSWIAGRPAVVEVRQGQGRVVLFGFRPQYRGQSLATYPMLFNALKRQGN